MVHNQREVHFRRFLAISSVFFLTGEWSLSRDPVPQGLEEDDINDTVSTSFSCSNSIGQ